MAAPPAADGGQQPQLEPGAFKRLYPQQFYARFVESGVRPDGRPFGRARPTTIGLRAVETTDASALVKVGATTVLAGLKLEVLAPGDAGAAEGQLVLNAEMTPLASKSARPGRPSDAAACCTEQVRRLLAASGAVDLSRLAIAGGKAAWVAYLDLYILDADGCLLDTCLLAAVAALASLRELPGTTVGADGQVEAAPPGQAVSLDAGGGLLLRERLPVALTCGLYGGALMADPTAEEEALMGACLTATVSPAGEIIGLFKPGGAAEAGAVAAQDCVAAAQLRAQEICGLLDAALAAA